MIERQVAVPVKESKGRRWCVTVGSGVLQLIGWSGKISLKSDVWAETSVRVSHVQVYELSFPAEGIKDAESLK